MAKIFAMQRRQIGGTAKTLAICGNVHARTANHSSPDNPLALLWPSFAADLQTAHSTWQINSINLDQYSGQFFNGGKVNRVGGQPIEEAQAHSIDNSDWNLQLGLPKVTPVTFLATPSNALPQSTAQNQNDSSPKGSSTSSQSQCWRKRDIFHRRN
jgi:hypothetical protein